MLCFLPNIKCLMSECMCVCEGLCIYVMVSKCVGVFLSNIVIYSIMPKKVKNLSKLYNLYKIL